MRLALGLEYDGSAYCGWQFQQHCSSVQEEVERALSFVANETIQVVCAGRTDAKVHATNQIIHFDTDVERSMRSWLLGTNTNLPYDISIQWVQAVEEEFHARFSAVERAYRYVIYNHAVRPALQHGRVTWWLRPLDVDKMQLAANDLIGNHDFTSYRAVGCQAKSPQRTVKAIEINRSADYIYLDIRADGFLHHMVRNIVGVLTCIGNEEKPVAWAAEVLAAKDRTQAGITAPPDGLYLTEVKYPEQFNLPIEQRLPHYS